MSRLEESSCLSLFKAFVKHLYLAFLLCHPKDFKKKSRGRRKGGIYFCCWRQQVWWSQLLISSIFSFSSSSSSSSSSFSSSSSSVRDLRRVFKSHFSCCCYCWLGFIISRSSSVKILFYCYSLALSLRVSSYVIFRRWLLSRLSSSNFSSFCQQQERQCLLQATLSLADFFRFQP